MVYNTVQPRTRRNKSVVFCCRNWPKEKILQQRRFMELIRGRIFSSDKCPLDNIDQLKLN